MFGCFFLFFFNFGGQGKGDQGKVVEWRKKGEEKSSEFPGVFKYMFIVREIHNFKIICLYIISILFAKEYCSFDVTLEVLLWF